MKLMKSNQTVQNLALFYFAENFSPFFFNLFTRNFVYKRSIIHYWWLVILILISKKLDICRNRWGGVRDIDINIYIICITSSFQAILEGGLENCFLFYTMKSHGKTLKKNNLWKIPCKEMEK